MPQRGHGLAGAAVHLERHRQLVGDGVADHLLVVVERRPAASTRRRPRSASTSPARGRSPCGRATASPSRGSRRPRSGRSRRWPAGRAAAGAGGGAGRSARRGSRGGGQASGPSVATCSSAPTSSSGSSLAHARCWVPNSRRRSSRPSSRRTSRREALSRSEARLSNSCRRPGRHQVDQQREVAELDHEHLPRPARPRSIVRARERVERRVERLHRDHARRQRGLDARAGRGAVSRRAAISTSGSSGMPAGYDGRP